MSVRKFVYSFKESIIINPFVVGIQDRRQTEDLSIKVTTTDNTDYNMDYAEQGRQDYTSGQTYNFDLTGTGESDIKIYKDYSKIRSLNLGGSFSGTSNRAYSILLSDLAMLSNLYNFTFRGLVTGDLGSLPTSLNFCLIDEVKSDMSYLNRKDFSNSNFQILIIRILDGRQIPSKEYDDLIIDLSQASFSGSKTLILLGNFEPRTSDSDSAVSVLQTKCNTLALVE
jgi:hypothetical protein